MLEKRRDRIHRRQLSLGREWRVFQCKNGVARNTTLHSPATYLTDQWYERVCRTRRGISFEAIPSVNVECSRGWITYQFRPLLLPSVGIAEINSPRYVCYLAQIDQCREQRWMRRIYLQLSPCFLELFSPSFRPGELWAHLRRFSLESLTNPLFSDIIQVKTGN